MRVGLQLTLDGTPAPARGEAERAVLALVVDQGVVSSSQAGRVVHRLTNERQGRLCCPTDGHLFGDGCCRSAASHGGEVLRRLAARGLVEKGSSGDLWYAVPPAVNAGDTRRVARRRARRKPAA